MEREPAGLLDTARLAGMRERAGDVVGAWELLAGTETALAAESAARHPRAVLEHVERS
jgi:hypothetical protein